MQETTSREKVLKKIRNALISKKENPFSSLDFESSVYQPFADSLDVTFALEFTKVSGKFIYCENDTELKGNLVSLIGENKWEHVFCLDSEIKNILDKAGISFSSDDADFNKMQVGITRCEYLIARLGSIMISSKQTSGRRLNVFPESHIVIAQTSQIVSDLKDALNNIKEKYNNNLPSLVSVITGPSRTADIEKTLVMGAHGPKELYVFLVDQE
ncbi:MAG: LUD domain-containing protein [Bacteroidales bacterium]|nr:LUD domain-containing protein [Bacteroidales bacterium]